MSATAPPRRWVVWLLVGYTIMAAVLLLAPGGPGDIIAAIMEWLHDGLGLSFIHQGWIEFAGNILLFVPLGFLLTLLFRRVWVGLVVLSALSVSTELVQMLMPARMASLRDILANLLGAGVGAAIASVTVIRRSSPPTATRRAR
ncbi:VanZ family protein [Microbacterium deminutum]|uniref:VanZ-like domain-containing protein n=1 Tax=Microbacterium deminutum TaxID=344164 RepID=A0ABP5BZT5_9MICO